MNPLEPTYKITTDAVGSTLNVETLNDTTMQKSNEQLIAEAEHSIGNKETIRRLQDELAHALTADSSDSVATAQLPITVSEQLDAVKRVIMEGVKNNLNPRRMEVLRRRMENLQHLVTVGKGNDSADQHT